MLKPYLHFLYRFNKSSWIWNQKASIMKPYKASGSYLKRPCIFVRWLYVWIHASKELKKAKQNGAIMHAMIKMAFLPNLFYWFCCYLFVFLLVWSVERKKFSLMFYNLGIKTMFYCFMRLFICFCQNTFDVEYDVWQSLTNLESVKIDCLFHFWRRTHFDKSFLKCF